jgi:hypothetical protein
MEILHVVVAVAQQGQGGTAFGVVRQFMVQHLCRLGILAITDESVNHSRLVALSNSTGSTAMGIHSHRLGHRLAHPGIDYWLTNTSLNFETNRFCVSKIEVPGGIACGFCALSRLSSAHTAEYARECARFSRKVTFLDRYWCGARRLCLSLMCAGVWPVVACVCVFSFCAWCVAVVAFFVLLPLSVVLSSGSSVALPTQHCTAQSCMHSAHVPKSWHVSGGDMMGGWILFVGCLVAQ